MQTLGKRLKRLPILKYAKFFNYLLENGIYIAPSQYEAMFVSMAHSDEDIEKTCKVIESYKG